MELVPQIQRYKGYGSVFGSTDLVSGEVTDRVAILVSSFRRERKVEEDAPADFRRIFRVLVGFYDAWVGFAGAGSLGSPLTRHGTGALLQAAQDGLPLGFGLLASNALGGPSDALDGIGDFALFLLFSGHG